MLCTLTMTLVLQCKSEVDHMRVAFRADWREINTRSQWAAKAHCWKKESSVFHSAWKSTPKLETNTHALFTIRWVLEIIKHHSATLANKRQCLLQVSLCFRPTKKFAVAVFGFNVKCGQTTSSDSVYHSWCFQLHWKNKVSGKWWTE